MTSKFWRIVGRGEKYPLRGVEAEFVFVFFDRKIGPWHSQRIWFFKAMREFLILTQPIICIYSTISTAFFHGCLFLFLSFSFTFSNWAYFLPKLHFWGGEYIFQYIHPRSHVEKWNKSKRKMELSQGTPETNQLNFLSSSLF